MSTPIWVTGDVLASLCATNCDRCGNRGRCIQLMGISRNSINLCMKQCFLELAHAIGWFAGDALRQAMGEGLRREGTLPLDCPSPFADGEEIARRRVLMTDTDRELLNRTWCATCQSHFCSCVKPRPRCKVCGFPPGQGLIGFDRITPACHCPDGGSWS